jgi:replicative DNA helicase
MLSKEGEVLIKAIGKYYDIHKVDTIDWSVFNGWFQFNFRKIYNKDQMSIYSNIIDKISLHDVDDTVINNVFSVLIEEDYAAQIHNIALKIIGSDEDYSLEDISDKLKSYSVDIEKYTKENKEWLDLSDVKHLVEATMGSGGFDWRLDPLNLTIGPLRKGHFVIVGARPDSGKTTFLISEGVNWARQLPNDDSCILWLNNEETNEKVGRRIIESGIMWDKSRVSADPIGAAEEFSKKIGSPHRIRIVKEPVFTVRSVEKYIKKFQPSLVIFDQLWKVAGFEKEAVNETTRQAMLFAWARNLASIVGPVITVHQLGGEADGERFPMMKHLYGSQTGIQGEADAIIFIGRSRDPSESSYRFLSVPKNKLGDGPKCDPTKRGSRYLIKIDYDHACFEEVEEYDVT